MYPNEEIDSTVSYICRDLYGDYANCSEKNPQLNAAVTGTLCCSFKVLDSCCQPFP